MKKLLGLAIALAAAWYIRSPQGRARFPALGRLVDTGRRR